MKTKKKPFTSYLHAVLAVTATIGVLVAWILAPKGNPSNYLFLLLGLTLLWSFYAVADLREEDQPEGASVEELSEEQKLAVQRYEERLATEEPIFTYGLMASIVLMFFLQIVFGHYREVASAGLDKPATRNGEWWRLLSSTYLHSGGGHIFMNAGALRALGRDFEACCPPVHLPLVYLLSALGGSLASLFLLPGKNSLGASGAILGLGGYLLIAARRRTNEVPPGFKPMILILFAITTFFGFFGYFFIDNAAHIGGAVTGALVGMAVIPRPGDPLTSAREKVVKVLGWLAALVLLVGALLTGLKLVRDGVGG